MTEITNTQISILLSIESYLNKLQYLASNNIQLANAIMFLIIVDFIYEWANWNDEDQQKQLELQFLRKKILLTNSELVDYIPLSNNYYKNINTPQTISTWQRIYDNPVVVTIETL